MGWEEFVCGGGPHWPRRDVGHSVVVRKKDGGVVEGCWWGRGVVAAFVVAQPLEKGGDQSLEEGITPDGSGRAEAVV